MKRRFPLPKIGAAPVIGARLAICDALPAGALTAASPRPACLTSTTRRYSFSPIINRPEVGALCVRSKLLERARSNFPFEWEAASFANLASNPPTARLRTAHAKRGHERPRSERPRLDHRAGHIGCGSMRGPRRRLSEDLRGGGALGIVVAVQHAQYRQGWVRSPLHHGTPHSSRRVANFQLRTANQVFGSFRLPVCRMIGEERFAREPQHASLRSRFEPRRSAPGRLGPSHSGG